jgi:hypothetical protein
MFALHEKYIVNTVGEKTSIILAYDEWLKVLDIVEEFEEISAYDLVKSSPSSPILLGDKT